MALTRFIEQSILDLYILQASDPSVLEILQGNSQHVQDEPFSALKNVAPRNILYFDELTNIYLVLQTSCNEEEIEAALPHLRLVFEAHAFGSPSHDQPRSAESNLSGNRDIIWSGQIDPKQAPTVIRHVSPSDDSTEQDERSITSIVWQQNVHLRRPKVRLHSPKIAFKVTATLQSPENNQTEDPYLTSLVPAPVNLLDSLNMDDSRVKQRLSALRLSGMSSSINRPPAAQFLRVAPQKFYRAVPALTARIRYSRSPGPAGKNTFIAALDLETAAFSDNKVSITAVTMHLSDGSVEDLCSPLIVKYPRICHPKDILALLFRLSTRASSEARYSPTKELQVKISATVLDSDDCHPIISMEWKYNVDFSTALNPSFGAPGQPMQRSKRPASLPVNQEADLSQSTGNSQTRGRAVSINDMGVMITFTAPRDVRVGQQFHWDVLVVNHSSKPRRLALLILPKRKPGDGKGHRVQPSTSSSIGGGREVGNPNPVVEENVLFAMHRNAARDAAEVVCLSTDFKVGPLQPGFCHSTELRFIALASGVLAIEAVRVIDVATNESVDVRDLPDIIATDEVSQGEEGA